MNFIPRIALSMLLVQFVGLNADQNDLGKELLKAAHERTAKNFSYIVKKVQSGSKENTDQFFEILNTRDKDGYNALLFFSLIGDIENLEVLFNSLEQFYGNNIPEIFRYLDTRTEFGVNALGLAEYNGNRWVIELILVRAYRLIGSDKNFFYTFINAADYKHGATPLIRAAQDSGSDNLMMMVNIAARVFGRHSDLFYSFINTKDLEGNTALSFALSNPDKFFLMGYGAREIEEKKEEDEGGLKRAYYLGKEFINAIKHADFDMMKVVVQQAVDEFKDNQDLLYHFFATHDENGWNALIHTAAEGEYDFVKFILESIEQHFLSGQKELKTFLMSHTDFEGRTALHLAIIRRHYRIAVLLVDEVIKHIHDKSLLLAFLNSPDELSGQTPFIGVVYGSGDYDKSALDFLKKLLGTAERVFGKKSRLFELFVNARDYNGFSALAYASDEAIKKLLVSYGALDVPMKKIKGIGDLQELEIEGQL